MATYVWVALESFPYEGYAFRGVAASKEAAQRLCQESEGADAPALEWHDFGRADYCEAPTPTSEYEIERFEVRQ